MQEVDRIEGMILANVGEGEEGGPSGESRFPILPLAIGLSLGGVALLVISKKGS